MSYVVSTTAGPSGKFESYDLDQLPKIEGRSPRELAQEGKLSPHQLYAILKQRGVPGISTADGIQALCICWARELTRRANEEIKLTGDAADNRDRQDKGR